MAVRLYRHRAVRILHVKLKPRLKIDPACHQPRVVWSNVSLRQRHMGASAAFFHSEEPRGGITTKPSSITGLAASLPEVPLIKWPTGSFPQLHRSSVLLRVLLSLEPLLTLISPRISRPEFPLSCKGAARERQARDINAKNNIIDLSISLSSI